jgi:Icc protein
MGSMPLLLAQLSDTHVVADDTDEVLYVDNNGRAAMAVAAIGLESPSVAAVLATGDLTQWGTDAEYDKLAEVLAPLEMPVLPIPGNHDTRAGLRRCFPDHPWPDARSGGDHLSWVIELEGVRIIGLDTTVPGEPGAAFDPDREEWLRTVLAASHAGPTLLAMHHPPFVTGIEWMDAAGFAGLDRFVAVIADAAVDRIICGHMHRPMSSMVAGVSAEVGMSTAVHIALDLAPDGPVQVVRDPIGYRIFRVDDSAIVGHTRYVDTGEVPFAPAWSDIK